MNIESQIELGRKLQNMVDSSLGWGEVKKFMDREMNASKDFILRAKMSPETLYEHARNKGYWEALDTVIGWIDGCIKQGKTYEVTEAKHKEATTSNDINKRLAESFAQTYVSGLK